MPTPDKKLAALLSRGHAQPEDILALDFAQGTVPGHDPDAMLQNRFVFRNQTHNGPTLSQALGVLSLPEHPGELEPHRLKEVYDFEQAIASVFSRRGAKALDVAVLAHETIHLQQFHAANLDFILGVDHNQAPVESTRWGGLGPVIEPLMARGESERQTADRHRELRRTLEGRDRERQETYPLLYRENQARLHQVVAAYVRQEHPLPQSRRELVSLYGALGGKAPRTPQAFAPETFTQPEDLAAWRAALDIRQGILGRLNPQARAAFFKTALPEMYGTLLEFYGDPQGRVKMGFPASPVYARNIADQILHEHFAEPKAAQWKKVAEKLGLNALWRPPSPVRENWSAEHWERMAAKAEPELLGRLLNITAVTGHRRALRPLLEAYRERAPQYSGAFLQALEWEGFKGVKADVSGPQAALLRHAAYQPRHARLGDEREALHWQRLSGVSFRKPGRLGHDPVETPARRKGRVE